jgi:hypothetical protein
MIQDAMICGFLQEERAFGRDPFFFSALDLRIWQAFLLFSCLLVNNCTVYGRDTGDAVISKRVL